MDPGTDWVASDGKSALDFDGSNDQIVLSRDVVLAHPYYAFSFWAKLRGAGPGIVIGDINSSYNYLWLYPGQQLRFYANESNADVVGLTFNNWAHYVVNMQSQANANLGDCTIWQNGMQVGSQTLAFPTFVFNRFGIARPGGQFPFDGQIDSICAWNRALAPGEIRLLSTRRGIEHEKYRVLIVRGSGGGAGSSLEASPVTTGAPSVGTPTLTQSQALSAVGIATAPPAIGNPTLTQGHSLAASGVVTGAPTLGTPTLSQSAQLVANPISAGAPSLGSPAVSQSHTLVATSLATGSPVLGTPSLSTAGQLTALPIATGAPSLGTPALSQSHNLTTIVIATGAPTVGSPVLSVAGQLQANAIVTGAPTLGMPVIAQVHSLVGVAITTGAPVIGVPMLDGAGGSSLIVGSEWVSGYYSDLIAW